MKILYLLWLHGFKSNLTYRKRYNSIRSLEWGALPKNCITTSINSTERHDCTSGQPGWPKPGRAGQKGPTPSSVVGKGTLVGHQPISIPRDDSLSAPKGQEPGEVQIPEPLKGTGSCEHEELGRESSSQAGNPGNRRGKGRISTKSVSDELQALTLTPNKEHLYLGIFIPSAKGQAQGYPKYSLGSDMVQVVELMSGMAQPLALYVPHNQHCQECVCVCLYACVCVFVFR